MDDAIHVKVPYHGLASLPRLAKVLENIIQIVKLLAVGIRTRHADRYLLSIYFSWLFLDDLRDDLGVLLRQPAKKRWNSHFCLSGQLGVVKRGYMRSIRARR